MNEHRKFPNAPDRERYEKEAESVKASDKDQRREHHKMLPIADAAGGTAAVLHNKPEGTPDKYTYQIADVENYSKNEKNVSRNDAQ